MRNIQNMEIVLSKSSTLDVIG
uniref:Uncharacterized protein n=1 Tax=Anguilla anguilla TaxID=7936 RepID=A0A0E9QZE8_ANGAN